VEAIQIERDGKKVRNDRILAVCDLSRQHEKIWEVKNLPASVLFEIESFFKQYNTLAGKEFEILGWKGSTEAIALIRSQMN
jgi:inorganic pyrophosphatase